MSATTLQRLEIERRPRGIAAKAAPTSVSGQLFL
jgi:hypothetical protein